MSLTNNCPCGSEKTYKQCCEPYHRHVNAPTAEALMRSRYSAFCLNHIDYIAQTMRDSAATDFDAAETKAWSASVYWLGLQIIETADDPDDKHHAFVEFIARFMRKDKLQCIHERSEFRCIEGHWYYVAGSKPTHTQNTKAVKIAKNAPCPCKSLKKFKNCHGQ